jgi:hypothetical protein
VNEEDPQEISLTQARKLLKATRKPRVYTEEQKAKMIENLQKGREKLKEIQQKKKEENDTLMQQAIEKAKSQVVVKKYIIKPKKKQKIAEDTDVSDTSLAETEESDTDAELYKKIKRKERMLKKINKLEQTVKQTKPENRTLPTIQTPMGVPPMRFRAFY